MNGFAAFVLNFAKYSENKHMNGKDMLKAAGEMWKNKYRLIPALGRLIHALDRLSSKVPDEWEDSVEALIELTKNGMSHIECDCKTRFMDKKKFDKIKNWYLTRMTIYGSPDIYPLVEEAIKSCNDGVGDNPQSKLLYIATLIWAVFDKTGVSTKIPMKGRNCEKLLTIGNINQSHINLMCNHVIHKRNMA